MRRVQRGLTEQGLAGRGPGRRSQFAPVSGGDQDDQLDFVYEIRLISYAMPAFAQPQSPDGDEHYYRAEVFLRRGGQSYDIYGYDQAEIISDILDQFESTCTSCTSRPAACRGRWTNTTKCLVTNRSRRRSRRSRGRSTAARRRRYEAASETVVDDRWQLFDAHSPRASLYRRLAHAAVHARFAPRQDGEQFARSAPTEYPDPGGHRRSERGPFMAEAIPALEIRNLHKRYGDLEVLKGISLTARDGDVISILGSSGSGKSTFCAASTSWKTLTRARSWWPASSSSSSATSRRPGRRRRQAAQPDSQRAGLRVPELQPLAAHDHPRQHHRGAAPRAGPEQGRSHRGGRSPAGQGRHRRQAPRLPQSAFRWPAAARGDRPHAGDAAQGDPVRRAHLGAGPGNGTRSAQ